MDLFLWLRDRAGLPLTPDQYYLLLEALQKGFGIGSRAELKQLCRLLWVKPHPSTQAEQFERYFDDYFSQFDRDQQPEKSSSPTPETPPPETTPSDKPRDRPQTSTTEPEPVLEVATAIRGEYLPEPLRSTGGERNFSTRVKDLPVTERQLQQTWRYLRRPLQEGPQTEVDIDATVEQIGQTGIFLEPVRVANRINRAELLLLVDVSNSMIPYKPLTERLIAGLTHGQPGKVQTFYFRNCPADQLYLHPKQPQTQLLSDLLSRLHANRTVALMVSDGGAARQAINRDRLHRTEEFLRQIKSNLRKIGWLNPLPRSRWEATTAEGIAQFVPMFELSASGLKAATRLIKS